MRGHHRQANLRATIPPSDVALWITLRDAGNVPHVVPDFGQKHDLTMECWCHPGIEDDRYAETGVIVHSVAQ